MKIVAISDTHAMHHKVRVPDGDILIHAGDWGNDGSRWDWRDFIKWFYLMPHKHKVLISGNHDWYAEKHPMELRHELPIGIDYLEDSGVEIEGIKLWGSPYSPRFNDWAFNVDRGEPIRKHWDLIPNDTDIVITHGPAYGLRDRTINPSTQGDAHVGCVALLEALLRVKPKMHICGHVHYSYGNGMLSHGDGSKTIIINAAICNEAYRPVNAPFVYYYEQAPVAT